MNILAVRRDADIPNLLVYLEDIPSEVCLRLSSLTSRGRSGCVDQVTEIVFRVPDGINFTSASLPSADHPLPITPGQAGECRALRIRRGAAERDPLDTFAGAPLTSRTRPLP